MDSLILSQATQLYQDLKMPVRNLPLCDRWIFDILMHNRRKTFCGFARLLITSLNLILSVVKGSFVRQDWIYCHWFWHWNFFYLYYFSQNTIFAAIMLILISWSLDMNRLEILPSTFAPLSPLTFKGHRFAFCARFLFKLVTSELHYFSWIFMRIEKYIFLRSVIN